MRAVRFDRYGASDVLYISEAEVPSPAKGEVLVSVKAAGINPGEASIRKGLFEKRWPAKFPSGQGSDFAGIVKEVGQDVKRFVPGDEVIGFTHLRASQAEYVIAEVGHLVFRPKNISWEQAGALFVAGSTAYAAVRAVSLTNHDTVVVAAAAGGVGTLTAQLAKDKAAKVIGLASEENHTWLKKHQIIPLSYGNGLAERILKEANGHVDAFIDLFGKGYVELAIQLGVDVNRINTIIDFDAVAKYHVKAEGSQEAATATVLEELAGLINSGKLDMPIAKTYPLSAVQEAYNELEKRHTRGKIVLIP